MGHLILEMGAGHWRGVIPWASVVVVAGLVGGAAWFGAAGFPSSASDRPSLALSPVVVTRLCNPPTKFAGYSYRARGPFTQISATWRVPTVTKAVKTGVGVAVWVGLASKAGAFIQLGTEVLAPSAGASITYHGVWGATRSFTTKAHDILDLRPGDVVKADISRGRSGVWRLRLVDVTQDHSAAFVVHYATAATFTTAQWFEEDMSPHCTIQSFLEPAPVTVGDLRLDRTAPRLSDRSESVIEAPNGIEFVASPLHDDSFTLGPPSGFSARYLHVTAPFNVALEEFEADVGAAARAAHPTRYRTGSADVQSTAEVAKGLSLEAVTAGEQAMAVGRHVLDELGQQRWPATASARVGALVRAARAMIAAVGSIIARSERSTAWTLERLVQSGGRVVAAANQVRQRIALPPADTVFAPM